MNPHLAMGPYMPEQGDKMKCDHCGRSVGYVTTVFGQADAGLVCVDCLQRAVGVVNPLDSNLMPHLNKTIVVPEVDPLCDLELESCG